MEDEFEIGYQFYCDKDYAQAIEHFRIAEKNGDARAAYFIGGCTFYGYGVDKNEEEGKKLVLASIEGLEKAAKAGVKRANQYLYVIYSNHDFAYNENKMFEILQRMYQTRNDLNGEHLDKLADYYISGKCCAMDGKKAHALHEESFKKYKSKYALLCLANDYENGVGVRIDFQKSLSIYKQGLKIDFSYFYGGALGLYLGLNGFAEDLFINYEEAKKIVDRVLELEPKRSDGTLYNAIVTLLKDKNIAEASRILKEYAVDDNISTFNNMYSIICHCPAKRERYRDFEQLNKLFFNRSLESKYSYAFVPYYKMFWFYRDTMYSLDKLHFTEGEEKECKSNMIEYLKKGSENNDTYCLWNYAGMLREGEFVERDESKAFECIKKSSELCDDFSDAFNELAECYEYGVGTEKNIDKAIEMYRKSCGLHDGWPSGSGVGRMNLIYLLDQVVATEESKREAKKLLNEAQLLGCDHAGAYSYNGFTDYAKKLWFNNLYLNAGDEKCINSLAYQYLDGKGTKKDVNKAIELFENDRSDNRNFSLAELGDMFLAGEVVEKDLDRAFNYYYEAATSVTGYFSRQACVGLFKIYTDKSSKYFNPNEGLKFLMESAKEADSEFERADNCYLLADFYHSNEFGLEDPALAKKYYELAYDLGINCQYAIESLKRDEQIEKFYQEGLADGKSKGLEGSTLNKYAKRYARDRYSEETPKGIHKTMSNILNKGVSINERKILIENELRDDFKEVWSDIKEESKKSMITALLTYSSYLEMGYDIYSELDMSPVVNGLSKAFEIELKEFFHFGYLKYLKDNNVSYKEFIDESSLTQLSIINSRIETKNNQPYTVYEYAPLDVDKNFSLGQIRFTLTCGQDKRHLNRYIDESVGTIRGHSSIIRSNKVNVHIVDYFDELFAERAFPSVKRKESIANYLLDLAEDVETVKTRRNSAAHEDIMTIDDAELCADYLIKVKRIMYNFLIKIKPECRKGYDGK